MNSPIYKDFFYTTTGSVLDYIVVADDTVIFRGKAWRKPGAETIKINVADIVRDWLSFSELPDFRELDDTVTKQEEAYKVFTLHEASTLTQLAEYRVLFDWTGEWNGETKVLSNPINGVLDPRMKILWTIYGPSDLDITMENGPVTINSYFRLLTTNIVMGQDGGEYRIRWLTDYMPSEEWTVTIDGMEGYSYHSASFSGITVDIPRNDTLSSDTYEIYYHIHGLTFGPTHLVQHGGNFDIVNDPGGSGPNSGDTEHIDWTTSFPPSSITYSADTWLEVTNVTSYGCDITFKEDNMSLEPKVGHVWIFVNDELAKTITVTQGGRYFGNMTPLITFPPLGGSSGITWDTDIPFAYLTAYTDTGDFVLSDFTHDGMTVSTTGNNMNYGYVYGNASVYSGTTVLGTTAIRQEGLYFRLSENPVNINSWTGSYIIHWDTNIPPELISWNFDGENINGSITDATQTGFTLNVHNTSWYDKIAYVDFYFSGDTFLSTLTINVKGNVGYDIHEYGDIEIQGTDTYMIDFGGQYTVDYSRIYDPDTNTWVSAQEYCNYQPLRVVSLFFDTGSTPTVEISGTTYAKVLNIQIDTVNHNYRDRYLKYAIVLNDQDTPIPIGETFNIVFSDTAVTPVTYIVTSQIITDGYHDGFLIPEEVYDYANVFAVTVNGENTEPNALSNHEIVSGVANDIQARVLPPIRFGGDDLGGYRWRAKKHEVSGGYYMESTFELTMGWRIDVVPPSRFVRNAVFTYGFSSGNSYTMKFSLLPTSVTILENDPVWVDGSYTERSHVTAVTIDNTIEELTIDGIFMYPSKQSSFRAIYWNGTKAEFMAIKRRYSYSTYDPDYRMIYIYCTDGTLGWTPGSNDQQWGHPEGYIEILN